MKINGFIRLGVLASIIFFGYQHWYHVSLIESLASDEILESAKQTCLKAEPSDSAKAAECYSTSRDAIYEIQSHAIAMYWSSEIYEVSLRAVVKLSLGWIAGFLAFFSFRWVRRGF